MQQTKLTFLISTTEKSLLEEVAFLEPWLEGAIDHRKRKGNQYAVRFFSDDCQDCVDALVYHADSGLNQFRREEYLILAQKISSHSLLDRYMHEHASRKAH